MLTQLVESFFLYVITSMDLIKTNNAITMLVIIVSLWIPIQASDVQWDWISFTANVLPFSLISDHPLLYILLCKPILNKNYWQVTLGKTMHTGMMNYMI